MAEKSPLSYCEPRSPAGNPVAPDEGHFGCADSEKRA